jgi:uncharacterized cupin superfamily protein
VADFNLSGAELPHASMRPGFRWQRASVGEELGAKLIGASLYELPPGEQGFPYHYHHGIEEWLLVVSGAPTLRSPTGEQELRAGDVVCFPSGPEGAHALRNESGEPARLLLLSHGGPPSVSAYPDSGKVGTRPGFDPDRLNFRRSDAVDYWEGE